MAEPSASDRRISTERLGNVFLIGLDRADKRNAFDVQMLHELSQAYTEYEDDEELWCALVFAHGEHFTAGLDLANVAPAVTKGGALFPEGYVDPLGLFGRKRSKPVVAAVQGWCLTIGIELSLACDIRVASKDTRFGQIEIKRGIMPFGGATLRWPAATGWGNAMRYLLTGDELGAEEAHRIGLVQEVCEPGEQFDVAFALAQRIAKQAPLGVQGSLVNARIAAEEGTDAALADLLPRTRALFASADAREGMMSFLERREANFEGQ